MRHLTRLTLFVACAGILGCEAAPTGPTEEVDMPMAPSAAVLSEGATLPYWHRGPITTSDGEYDVIYFYVKDPEVIPDDFNLLGFFDFRAFAAEFAVESLLIWKNAGDFAPMKQHAFAVAPVEFWFVPTATLQAAAGDGFLGVDELLATGEVIIGHSSHFGEELHPSGGSAKQVSLHVQARGSLDEGGSFHFLLSGHINDQTGEINGRAASVRLDFD